jgi:shikimate dehydrogenase
MSIPPKPLKAGVIGDPIAHSLSPKIHNFLLDKYNIDGIYIPIQVPKGELQKSIQSLIDVDFAGFNVTLPHKEEIFKICDFKSKTAQLTGAVNTVIITPDKKLFGHNSDAEGFLNNLKNSFPDFDLKNKSAFLIGAGGASRALIYAIMKSGAKEIFITNRSEDRAREVIKNFANFSKEVACEISFLPMKEFEKNLNKCDFLVNSTSLGMHGQDALEIDLKNLKKSAIVYDIVYKPLMTDLLKNSEKNGNRIVTGIGMLVYQAMIGFEAWFKRKPEADQELLQNAVSWSQNS